MKRKHYMTCLRAKMRCCVVRVVRLLLLSLSHLAYDGGSVMLGVVARLTHDLKIDSTERQAGRQGWKGGSEGRQASRGGRKGGRQGVREGVEGDREGGRE